MALLWAPATVTDLKKVRATVTDPKKVRVTVIVPTPDPAKATGPLVPRRSVKAIVPKKVRGPMVRRVKVVRVRMVRRVKASVLRSAALRAVRTSKPR